MVEYHYLTKFILSSEQHYTNWLGTVVSKEGRQLGPVNYVFVTDEYLLDLNRQYLNHDYYTDILSFDYSEGAIVSGDIFISVDRVKDNAMEMGISAEEEVQRVMAHGLLHFMGYKDKGYKDRELMRSKEDEYIKMFHVEQ